MFRSYLAVLFPACTTSRVYNARVDFNCSEFRSLILLNNFQTTVMRTFLFTITRTSSHSSSMKPISVLRPLFFNKNLLPEGTRGQYVLEGILNFGIKRFKIGMEMPPRRFGVCDSSTDFAELISLTHAIACDGWQGPEYIFALKVYFPNEHVERSGNLAISTSAILLFRSIHKSCRLDLG